MTHADDRVYVYIERYRPELMIWARTPRNIEREVLAENPHVNIEVLNDGTRGQVSLQPPSLQPPSLQPPSGSQKPSSSEKSSQSQRTSQNALVIQHDSSGEDSEVDSR